MNLKVISRNVGYALLVSALFMFLSIIVSVLSGNDSALAALVISFTITFIFGAFPFIFVRKTSGITLKDGFMIIFLSWTLSFIFGMLPYVLWGGPFTVANAWFESVSGFTTTGSTILEDVESLPKSLQFWRCSTHFIGGLGVVVFLLLIIPSSSQIRFRLTNMELSSLSKEGYRSQSNKTVMIFTSVYLGLVALSTIIYFIGGMSLFDAVCNAFSVSATGGFCNNNLSIGGYNSNFISIATIVLMLLSSIHFGIIYMTVVNRSIKPLKNPVLRFYLGSVLIVSIAVVLSLKINGTAAGWGQALMDGSFQVVSYVSTTGFATADNSLWPMFPCILLMYMGVQCGMAGSTTGGIKSDRTLLLYKAIRRQIRRQIYPTSVFGLKMGQRTMQDEEIYPHVLYIAVFFSLIIISTMLCMLFGQDVHYAIAGTIASLGNVGPAFGELGTYGNYNHIPTMVKFIFTADMFMGRIEIYPVLAALSMMIPGRNR